MFGYVKPNLPYLYNKDDTLYKSLYCGVCKSIGAHFGTAARFTLTYDVAFLSAVAHNIVGLDVTIKKERCVLHHIVKRPIAADDKLTEKLAAVNIILASYKVEDDIIDNKKGKTKKALLNKSFKKAKSRFPEIDGVVKNCYNELRKLEIAECGILDKVCEPFAEMLSKVSCIVLDSFSTEQTESFFYYLGKWIYLIDAFDDYDADIKKKQYNPFRLAYNKESAKELITAHGKELAFVFEDCIVQMQNCFNNIRFTFNTDLIYNIVFRGLADTVNKITEKNINGKR